jgi:hypothetical protein
MQFTELEGQVITNPKVILESPFQAAFDVKVKGDVMPVIFTTDYARSLWKNIHNGDFIFMNGFIDKGTLVVGFVYLEKQAAVGRNLNIYG